MTTLVVTPTFVVATASASYSLYQGNGVGTASDLASTALPTQLVFDSSVPGNPLGAATTGNAATMSVSPVFIGTANPKSLVTSTALPPSSAPAETTAGPTASSLFISKPAMIGIIAAIVAAALIAALLLFLWYRKRTRRRGHGHSRASSEEYGTGPPASDVLRKLGTSHEKSADPFSDAHAAPLSADPFADPEKPGHARTGSDSFLSMSAPRAPYTHAASASTGSSASGKARKREMEEARKRELAALSDLARALDQKERQAQAEGRDRRSLPPVELFKAALVR